MGKSVTFPSGYRHVALGDVKSTNTICLDYLNNDDPGQLWISAEQQLEGKGSRGRNWVSVPGNLYASLLLRLSLPPEILANLAFVASLALYEALAIHISSDALRLKWPNDVLMNGAKISGILLENLPRQNQGSGMIIGIGVNCKSHPSDTLYNATNLVEQGVDLQPLELLRDLAFSFDRHLAIWSNGNNFKTIRQLWLERAQGIGERIVVKMPMRQMSGIFEDIDEQGLLVLKTDTNSCHRISTADIFFSNHNQKSA